MKDFPYKTLFLCIFLPPVCYVLTLNALEQYFERREGARIRALMIQNHEALYHGWYTVKDEVSRNIGAYLGRSLKYRVGVMTSILVKTGDGRVLFPQEAPGPSVDGDFIGRQTDSLRYIEVASENYRTLHEGLTLSVAVRIRHNSWLSNAILVLYVLLAVVVIRLAVGSRLRKSERERAERQRLIELQTAQLMQAESMLGEVEAKEAEYLKRIDALKKERNDLATDIDGLLEEIEKQEAGLSEHIRLKEEMTGQVLQLRKELEKQAAKTGKKKKTTDATAKRFAVLYKNLAFTERAVEGFLELTDEFQLKAEEVIHKLNENESAVPVKRKVFGKGGKMNFLEVSFSYSGRIYFRKDSQTKKTVVAVGTKNSQEKDLAFLESIAS